MKHLGTDTQRLNWTRIHKYWVFRILTRRETCINACFLLKHCILLYIYFYIVLLVLPFSAGWVIYESPNPPPIYIWFPQLWVWNISCCWSQDLWSTASFVSAWVSTTLLLLITENRKQSLYIICQGLRENLNKAGTEGITGRQSWEDEFLDIFKSVWAYCWQGWCPAPNK